MADWEKKSAEYERKLEQAKEAVLECSHPAPARRPLNWEHDNGYGVQTQFRGSYCTICDAEDRWNRWKKE